MKSSGKNRLLSLDVFRGATIALMILVNSPGDWANVYAPLLHAKWHGCTLTDLVFPFFMCIIGVSMFFSYQKFNNQLSKPLALKILTRTLFIFTLGFLLNCFPFKADSLRIMGVLQRIGIAYGFAAFLCLLIPLKHLWKVALSILLVYWGILFFFGGTDPYAPQTNIARIIDLALLGENHLWRGFGFPFDPEGLASTLPAIVSPIIGYYIGYLIKTSDNSHLLVKNLLLLGVSGVALGLFWQLFLPLNKGLWTSSYVVYTGGIAVITLAVCMELIDIKGKKRWLQPFIAFGMNPLAIFLLSSLIVKVNIYLLRWTTQTGAITNLHQWLFTDFFFRLIPFDAKLASLAFALFYVGIHWLVALLLFKHRVFIKI